ncbi:thioredoxin family protein [Rhodanobacter aciditrophus]|uniref:Thioredoxin family protein n=1 Tax=Rhodanobacter aciditrophus TaxID=1623218 RepID=A0ABW4AYY2_9GAMM
MNIMTGYNPTYDDSDLVVEEVLQAEDELLIEFGTPWCGHCKQALPVIESVMDEYSDVSHLKVFDGKGKRLGRHFSVKLWPTLILVRNGKEVGRVVRPDSEAELRDLLEQ